MADSLYTFEFDGECMDLECATEKELTDWIDGWWAQRHDDEPMKNGDTREDEGFVVKFHFDEDGERVVESREKYALVYEYYHGDFAEHNTHWGL